jgi:hypothetical protein
MLEHDHSRATISRALRELSTGDDRSLNKSEEGYRLFDPFDADPPS